MAAYNPLNPIRYFSSEIEGDTEEEAYNNSFIPVEKKSAKKHPRRARPWEDRHSIESLKAQSGSDSDSPIFQEARADPHQSSTTQDELKVLLIPIESTKNLGHVNPIKIAKEIEKCAGPHRIC